MWYGEKPDLSHLKELGCHAWVLKQTENPKIYSRSIECVLVGYSASSKAYRCLDRSTRNILVSRDVSFAESLDSLERLLNPGLVIDNPSPGTAPAESHTTPSSESTSIQKSTRSHVLTEKGAAQLNTPSISTPLTAEAQTVVKS